MSCSSADEVSMTTGSACVRLSDFRRRSTSIPPSRGIFTSSKISFGCVLSRVLHATDRDTNSSASTPPRTRTKRLTSPPLRRARVVISASGSLSSTSNMSTAPKSSIAHPRRKGEGKHRTAVHFAIRPYAAAMPRHHPLDDGKAHAGAAELVRTMQPLEHTEQFVGVFHIESHPVVPYRVDILGSALPAAHLDPGLRRLAAVLDRIGDQVRPHLPQEGAVAPHRRQGTDRHPRRRRAPGQSFGDHFADQRFDVDLLCGYGKASKPGKLQQIINQGPHAFGVGADHTEVAHSLRIQPRAIVLLQHLREAIDGAQRRSEIMRHRIAEALEFPVADSELLGL